MDPRHTPEWRAHNWRRKADKYLEEAAFYRLLHELGNMSDFACKMYEGHAADAIAKAEAIERLPARLELLRVLRLRAHQPEEA